MKWFKHYSNARHSLFLSELKRQTGFSGIGRYWTFLEFLAEQFDGECVTFDFSRETLRDLFGLRSWNDLETFAERLGNGPAMDVERFGNDYRITAPILLELKSKDFKKARHGRDTKAPKIKIKNKIENNISERPIVGTVENVTVDVLSAFSTTTITADPMHVVDLWNEMLGPEKGYSSGLGSGEHLKNFLNSTGFLPTIEHWRKLFGMVKASKFLIEKPWCKLTWLVNYDNALKVLDGNYTDDQNENAVRALNKQAIKAAITSGHTSIKDLPPGTLKTDEIDFIKNNGGLLQLGRMNEFELNQLLNKGIPHESII